MDSLDSAAWMTFLRGLQSNTDAKAKDAAVRAAEFLTSRARLSSSGTGLLPAQATQLVRDTHDALDLALDSVYEHEVRISAPPVTNASAKEGLL